MEFHHVSVLLNECIEGLNINPDGIYVDGTLGGGGHSYEICKRLSEKGRLIGITTFRLKDYSGNIIYGMAFCIPIRDVIYYLNS